MGDDLRSPANDAEWAAYHRIRREVLFERRGHGDAYDANHPDDRKPGHYPLVLWSDGDAVGVIRVDIAGEVAFFRRVAVREDAQRLGHGREMLGRAEQFALAHGCLRVESYVDAGAIGFYERCGFRGAPDAPKTTGVLMQKELAARS